MKKWLVAFFLVFVFAVTAFGADGSLEKVKKDGKFIVGLDDTFAPMGFKDEKGEIVGFDIDLAKEVAKRLGVTAEFKSCEWDGVILELKAGKIDMVWNGMTITEERAKQVSFSKPYHSDGQIIFSRKDKQYLKISELEGKVVGTQLGSSATTAVEKHPISAKFKELRKYGTNAEALLDLESGRLDAVVMDATAGRFHNAKRQTLVYSEESFAAEVDGVAFRNEDVALREAVDKLLDEMKADGTFRKIEVEWLGE
ncbi:MAG: amino acid ABC transporter substrate-binding protein [Fusobacteriaceae bacterium]|jgi:polar amino acid transport system substrate-binding protein|nr:amino acid ABC transporter substrate-binding protein [Fusobacteriaceae bacterium]